MKPFLSVIIPCYNEEKNLKRGVLDEVDKYLQKQKWPSEVIISDDESTDNSRELVQKYLKTHSRFKLLENKHAGKPFAVRAGIEKAQGEVVLFTDMDQSAPLKEFDKLLPFFQKGFEVVIGSRGQKREGFSLVRLIGSNVFRLIRQQLLLKKIVDTQCGFKAFKNKMAKDLFLSLLIFKEKQKTKGWKVGAFDVELLFIAQKRGYKIAEVEINWEDKDIGKQKKYFKESKEMLQEIIRVKLNDLQGRYG
ncbi:glycosyltransferase [Candidatus Shapirobacteria bacterium]|nr:glycosyltransferase [Candidatus Shapirobacteria bacterium]